MDDLRSFLSACEEGDVSSVEASLDAGLDVNSADCEDVTGLQIAAANGNDHVVRVLLMRGAGLDLANALGWTPLLQAARHGHVGVISVLLQHQADINAITKLGANALLLASRGGHLQTVKLLIEAGIDMSLTSGIGGSSCEFTPLQIAALHGHDTVLRQVLDRGFDVNHRTPSTGINALMLAALNGHMTTAQILIERGADTNRTNVNEHTPLDIAALKGKREVKGYLERKTTNKSKQIPQNMKPGIIEATKQGNLQWIQQILSDDLIQRDATSPEDGATPLMFAAMTGRLDIAQLLIEKGCDINKQDTVSGWTALMQAMYHGRKMVAKFLVNAGAEVSIPAKNGCTAFDMASLIEDVDTDLYRLLAARALQINRTTSEPVGLHSTKRSRTWSPKQQIAGAQQLMSLGHQYVHRINRLFDKHLGSDYFYVCSEEQPKTGLKAWWSRMSNRFRNLKLGRTFSLNTNRLAPLPADMPPAISTLKSSSIPKSPQSPMVSNMSLIMPPPSGDPQQLSTTSSSLAGYDTLIQENKKNTSIYTLGLAAAPAQDGSLMPIVPPFHPPPTFQSDRSKMPPTSSRKSISSLQANNFTLAPPRKLLQSYSIQNLSITNSSPSASQNNSSPSSSGGASALNTSGGTSGGPHRTSSGGGPSSASSSTLTAGSNDNLLREGGVSRPHLLFTPVSSRMNNSHHSLYQHTAHRKLYGSMNSSLNHSSLSRGKSGSSSRDSGSTLTPSPSPTSKPVEPVQNKSSSHTRSAPPPSVEEVGENLGSLLKTLSLERYQPIFEEQEVDMEAFLTLTDTDLRELGIAHGEPRRQILVAITELNTGKGRERQHLQDTMSHYSSSVLSAHSHVTPGQLMELNEWSSGEGSQTANSTKSRSS